MILQCINSPFLSSLYKFTSLQGTPRNATHALMRPWDVFLRDRRATTSPVRGDRQAFFIPGVPRRHFNSTCRSTLHRFRLPRTFQTTEGGRYPDRFLPSIFVYKLIEGKFSGQNALPDMKYHYFHNCIYINEPPSSVART